MSRFTGRYISENGGDAEGGGAGPNKRNAPGTEVGVPPRAGLLTDCLESDTDNFAATAMGIVYAR